MWSHCFFWASCRKRQTGLEPDVKLATQNQSHITEHWTVMNKSTDFMQSHPAKGSFGSKEMALLLKCLLHLDFQSPQRKLGTVACDCTPAMGDRGVDPRSSQASHYNQINELKVHKEILSQKIKWRAEQSFRPVYTHTHTYTTSTTHTHMLSGISSHTNIPLHMIIWTSV